MKKMLLIAVVFAVMACVPAYASFFDVFIDDFESGNLNNWTQIVPASPMTIDNTQNIVPIGGTYAAKTTLAASRLAHSLGQDLLGVFTATWWVYDDTLTRSFGEIRSYSGGAYNVGTLNQIFAAGKYNTIDTKNGTYNASKYQCRALYPSAAGGWFNLDAPGSPNRSTGWHKFTVKRYADGSLDYFVDDLLGRSFAAGVISGAPMNVVVLGFGTTSSSNGNSWYDGVHVMVPEPGSFVALASGLIGLGGFIIRRRK